MALLYYSLNNCIHRCYPTRFLKHGGRGKLVEYYGNQRWPEKHVDGNVLWQSQSLLAFLLGIKIGKSSEAIFRPIGSLS